MVFNGLEDGPEVCCHSYDSLEDNSACCWHTLLHSAIPRRGTCLSVGTT